MAGAGQKFRGEHADMLPSYPAWELVRVMPVMVPRDWPSRWTIAGGKFAIGGRMIALKGDPIWGELGSYDNFPDALGVDYPPFAFNSGMGWKAVSTEECQRLGITGPGVLCLCALMRVTMAGVPGRDHFAARPSGEGCVLLLTRCISI
jgi:hypothetical protein